MLNNNGWGYRSFLIGGSVLLIFLLIATFFIMRLYSNLPDLSSFMLEESTYSDIETKLDESSLKYINDYYTEEISNGVITISTDNLLKYKMLTEDDLIETSSSDKCMGYSLIRNKDNKLTSESYIKCDGYQTEGYQEWRLGA